MKKIITLLSILIFSSSLYSQEWLHLGDHILNNINSYPGSVLIGYDDIPAHPLSKLDVSEDIG